MIKQHWEFVARPPRHSAQKNHDIAMSIRHSHDSHEPTSEGEMKDLSRKGIRFTSNADFPPQSSVILELSHGSDFRASIVGTIRWQRPAAERLDANETPSHWLYGCEFEQELSWEILGELMLRGLLALD